MLLSNAFSDRLDDLVNISDKEDVISLRQTRNATSLQLPGTGRNRFAGHSETRDRMEDVNEDMSEVCFLDRRIIKCN